MNEWREPNPSREQNNYWQYIFSFSGVPIAFWPHPNTPRINCRYRFKDTSPTLIPLASRYSLFFRLFNLPYDPVPAENNGIWVGDLLVKGDNHIGVTTVENKDGYTLDIDIQHKEELENAEEPGIEYRVKFNKVGLNSRTYIEEYPSSIVANLWRYNMNTDTFNNPSHTYFEFPDAPTITQFIPHLYGVGECFDFPKLPVGMASFNGSNAYIALDHNTINHNGPHFCEADVRFHDDGFQAIFGRKTSGAIWGFEDDDGRWSVQRFEDLDLPSLGTWFKYREEFEWSSGLQLRYELFVDDVLIRSVTAGRINTTWANLGVRRREGTADWGHFDMKNLIYKTGSFGSPVTRLDMPLFDNALDLSPDANHGSTFNMSLPSV